MKSHISTLCNRFPRCGIVILIAFLAPMICLSVTSAAAIQADAPDKSKAEMRTWKDSTGKFEVEAKLIEKTDKVIKLENADGKTITVPFDKLSDEDKTFLAGLEEKMKADSANPFTVDEHQPAKEADPIVPSEGDAETIVAEGGDWGLDPDPVTEEMAPWIQQQQTATLAKSSFSNAFHNQIGKLATARDVGVAALSFTNVFDSHSEIYVASLTDPTKGLQLKIPRKDTHVAALSPSAKTLITIKHGQSRNKGRLDFWQLQDQSGAIDWSNTNPENVSCWQLADFFKDGGPLIKRAEFLGEDRLLTFGNKLTLWDIEKNTAIYSMNCASEPKTGISANQKQLAFLIGNTLGVLDVKDGTVLGVTEVEPLGVTSLAFSPSGEYLAGFGNGYAAIWSLSDGSLIREINIPGSVSSGTVSWPDENYLLVGGKTLVDISLRVAVWNYQFASNDGSVVQINGNRFCYVGHKRNEQTRLVPVQIPHQDLGELTADFDAEELLVLKPGSIVSLKIDLPFAPDELQEIRDAVYTQFEEAGVTIEEKADIQLRMFVDKGKPDTISLRSMGGPRGPGRRGTTEVNYTPTTSRIELVKEDKVLWSRLSGNRPGGIIRSGPDETAEDVIKRQCQPKKQFFSSILLPRSLAQLPAGKSSLGNSTISNSGIK